MRPERRSEGAERRKETRRVEASQEGRNKGVFMLPFYRGGVCLMDGLNQHYATLVLLSSTFVI